ncbi:MAG: hypothetical protein IKZ82_09405 [Clostridia bacterium]|nr:hypothetical protein [Clostridia bacterium]
MKKNAIGLILLAVGSSFAISACAAKPEYAAGVFTVRPQQTQSVSTPAPHQASATALPPAPTEASVINVPSTEVPSTPNVQITEAPIAAPTELPPEATAFPAEPTATPAPIEKVKLDSFSFADNDMVAVDLDYDGISENVSIVQDAENGGMKLVIDAGSKYEVLINMDVSSLVCAYVTDFCFGDGSAEIMISYMKPDGSYVTSVVGSFSSDTPVSCATFDGWVESLSEEGLRLCRTADVLGMRGISMLHTYSSENGSFVPLDKEWIVYSYGQYAVIDSELRVVVFTDEGEETVVLEEGTLLIPTATDFYSYIDFETDADLAGRILISYENGESFMYEGVELNSLFEELPAL